MFDRTEEKWQILRENWLVLSKTTWRISQIFVYTLKNSNVILESKMAELNQNKNSKQSIDFTLKINE